MNYKNSQYVDYGKMLYNKGDYNTMDAQLIYKQPVISIFVLGVLSLISLILALLMRCCIADCRCKPSINDDDNPVTDKTKNTEYVDSTAPDTRRICIDVFFYFLCIVVVTFDLIVLFGGNFQISEGVRKMSGSLTSLRQTFSAISDSVSLLNTYENSLKNDVVKFSQNTTSMDLVN